MKVPDALIPNFGKPFSTLVFHYIKTFITRRLESKSAIDTNFYLWFKLILDYFEIYLQTQSIMHKLNLKWVFRFDVWGWRQPDAVLNLSILCVVCSYYSILLTKNISQFQTKCFWQLHLTITRICSEL